MHTSFLVRTLAASALALLATGCATTSDPYYDPYPAYPRGPEPGIIYGPGAYPVYPVAPPPDWRHADRERWERDRRERERWERERWERERERDKERDRARWEREQREREAARREREMREREEARRVQAERERRIREERKAPDGGPRRDYDRYNPSNGRWMPRQEDMP